MQPNATGLVMSQDLLRFITTIVRECGERAWGIQTHEMFQNELIRQKDLPEGVAADGRLLAPFQVAATTYLRSSKEVTESLTRAQAMHNVQLRIQVAGR
jgi:hypothetical protein